MDDETTYESRHISEWVNRSAVEVYSYACDPARLPEWAAGLAQGQIAQVDDHWVAQSPMGEIKIDFAPLNDFGILDHTVTLPSGEHVLNPMRVIPATEISSELLFSLRRQPGMSDAEFDADATAVAQDLATLKRVVEERAAEG